MSEIRIPEKLKEKYSDNNKETESVSQEKTLFKWRIIINSILSLILITIFFLIWTSYTPGWQLFFFISIWSFWSNTFYIVSITIIDICLYKGCQKPEKLNNWIRNYFIRIFFPFSISTVIIYWELVLLGEQYQDIGHSVLDICKSFFMHGLVLIFVCFDIFSSKHLNKNNNYRKDILIISIIVLLHFGIIIICKEFLNLYQWNFLIIADFRQIIASFIIIYLITLNGYIILYLISDNFFIKEEINTNKEGEILGNCENNGDENINLEEKKENEKMENKSDEKADNEKEIKENNNKDEKNEEEKNKEEKNKEEKNKEENNDEKNIVKKEEEQEKEEKKEDDKNNEVINIKRFHKKNLHVIIPKN